MDTTKTDYMECTDENYYKLCRRIYIALSAFEHQGLAGLGEVIDREKLAERNDLLEIGLYEVLNGTNENFLQDILDNYAYAKGVDYCRTFMEIIKAAILHFQGGVGTRLIMMKIDSIYGRRTGLRDCLFGEQDFDAYFKTTDDPTLPD
jgi:hypothetical protein